MCRPGRFRAFSQNENEMNYKNSHRMECLLFVLRQGSCWFPVNTVDKSGAFGKRISNGLAQKKPRAHLV